MGVSSTYTDLRAVTMECHTISYLLLLLPLLLLTWARPHPSQDLDDQELLNNLTVLQTRLVTYVETKFPDASQEEQENIIKMLVNKMKNKIVDQLKKSSKSSIHTDKGDLLARMLR